MKKDTGVVEAQEEAAKLCKLSLLSQFILLQLYYLFTVKEVTEKVEEIKVDVYLFTMILLNGTHYMKRVE